MANNETLEFATTQLVKYEKQLQALETSKDYEDFEEAYKLLRNFYIEKIKGFKATINRLQPSVISTANTINILVITRKHCQTKFKRLEQKNHFNKRNH